MKEWKHKCMRSLLTYRPDPLRPDCITVGFMLVEVDGQSKLRELRLAPDLSALRCLAPDLAPEIVEQMLLEAEPELKSLLGSVTDLTTFPHWLPDTVPDELELLTPSPVLTNDFAAEVQVQCNQFFRSPASIVLGEEQRTNRQYGRLYLQKQMRSTFAEYGVWDHLDKRIAVDRFSLKGDSFMIECGYEDAKGRKYRMFDPVSLVTGLERAKIIALSWQKISDGLQREKAMPCELHVIVEDGISRNHGKAADAWKWMEGEGIRVDPRSFLPALASDARSALRL